MQIEVIRQGQVLRTVLHHGQTYVEAPPEGSYSIRLRNTTHKRQMAVVSVDGVNVVNGEDAGFDGPGYVLNAWQAVDIPGWRRTDGTVAAFRFEETEKSYAAQTGRGTNNVGVIGVAVYDEKVQPQVPRPIRPLVVTEHHGWPPSPYFGNIMRGMNTNDSMPDTGSVTCSVLNATTDTMPIADPGIVPIGEVRTRAVGTGYGAEQVFHTSSTTFERASTTPTTVVTLRYGTKEQLVAWGVPPEAPVAVMPNAFPVSRPSVPAPPGWGG